MVPGNSRFNTLAQPAHVLCRGRVARLERDQNVRVRRPDDAAGVVTQIDGGIGDADVFERAAEFVRRNFPDDGLGDAGRRAGSVSSMRVPVAARRCSRNWPASTFGKKSWPSARANRPRSQRRRPERSGQTAGDARSSSPAARDSRRENGRSRLQTRAGISQTATARPARWIRQCARRAISRCGKTT